jgi:predicted nucleic acid-binding protein
MIAFLDTSAIVPLLIDEEGSDLCRRIWAESDAVVCTQLAYVEAAAALAQAQRLGRMTDGEHAHGLERLDRLWDQLNAMAVDEPLIREGAALAAEHALRGYDAVHCAAAVRIADPDVVAVTGDRSLITAWGALGLAVVDTAS